jgi:nucleoside-diphosphate-sugar epimerase
MLATRNPRVTLRTPDSHAPAECEGVLVGDIDQHTDWNSAIKNIDCVIHMAGRVHVMNPTARDQRRFHEVNVLGTERLALAAAENGVKRFVFLSSVKVNGEATAGQAFRATDRPQPVDDYGRSKWDAEQKLFAISRSSGMEVMVIRPPLVYGPRVRANFLRLLSWVHKGVPMPFGAIHNARSMVSVWNLCDLICRAVDAPVADSRVLMVSDGADLSTPTLIRKLAGTMGRTPRLLPVPLPLLKVVGIATGRSAEVARLCGSLTVDITETKRTLAWTPPVSIDEGLARTVHWYLSEVGARAA